MRGERAADSMCCAQAPCWGRFELKMSSASEVSAVFHAKDGQNARKIWSWAGSGGPSEWPGKGSGRLGGVLECSGSGPGAPGTVPGASREVRGRPGGAPGTVREGRRGLPGPFGAGFWTPGAAPGPLFEGLWCWMPAMSKISLFFNPRLTVQQHILYDFHAPKVISTAKFCK